MSALAEIERRDTQHKVASWTGCVQVLALVLLASLASHASAEHRIENRVQFAASAEREVANDRVVALLQVEHQAKELGELNRVLNTTMARAVEVSAQWPSVEVETRPAGTWPLYDEKSKDLRLWRGSQTLLASSTDFDAMRDVIEANLADFSVNQITYSLQASTREEVEDELTSDALLKVQNRASLIAHQMGMREVRFISLSITSTGGARPGVPYGVARMSSMAESAPPSLESGSSNVGVSVQVEIELVP